MSTPGFQVTPDQIKQISLGFGRTDICTMVANAISTMGGDYHLDTVIRVKHFLGQCAIESDFYRRLEENLNYSEEGLLKTFGAHRITPAQAKAVGKNASHAADPKGIANIIYGGDWGKRNLGNTGPHDGWDMRGSSIKQITGHENFYKFTSWMRAIDPTCPDFVANPSMLRTLDWAVYPALWYWETKGCYHFADNDDAKGLTRAINGGMNGYDSRVKATAVAAKVLGTRTNPVVTTTPPKLPDPMLMQYQAVMKELSKVMQRPDFDPGDVDGWQGKKTADAATAIQEYTKIDVDGRIGPNTRKAIDLLADKYGIR